MMIARNIALAGLAWAVAAETTHTPLNITAISSRGGYSVLECWQLESVPVEAMSAANYALGGTTKATWSRIEPRTTVGEAWAPTVHVILNGMIRITSPAPAPKSTDEEDDQSTQRPQTRVAYVMPGTLRSSVVIAADLKSVSTAAGHYTEFPSDEPTVLVQVPFEGDRAPAHVVLYEGACI